MPVAPPSNLNFARHLLEVNEHRPHKVALIDDSGEIRYGELANKIRRLGSALRADGWVAGDRVLIVMPDRIEWPVAFLGAMYAGLIPVPVNTLLPGDDYTYLIEHSEARAAIVAADLLPRIVAARERAAVTTPPKIFLAGTADQERSSGLDSFSGLIQDGSPAYGGADTRVDDMAFWLYSSGSTGRPKGVVHSHANLYWTAELYGKPVMGITEEDRIFSAAKLFFAYGLGNALTFPMSVGASAVLMAERPTPPAVLKRLKDHDVSIFCGAPTLYASLLASSAEPTPGRLRVCTSAGEPLPLEVGRQFSARFGVPILDGLGSTEMLHIFVSNRLSEVSYGATGRPVEGYQIELRDDQGAQVQLTDEIGDLWVKGPSAALRYWNEEDKTRSTFQDGWVRTGDKYLRRPDGCFVYAGRNDDMLKISGQYVSPFEVESTLMQHPSVLESAVIAVPDELGICKSRAYVVLKAGSAASPSTAEELKLFVKSRLAPFKRPHQVEFITELPKTATGKIQRFKLREQAV